MRFLFSTMGSDGDFYPLIRIGMVLRYVGHEVIFLTQETSKDWIESLGFGFELVATKEEVIATEKVMYDPDLEVPVLEGVWDTMLEKLSRRLIAKVEETHVPGETVLIALTRLPGARMAREMFQIPLISVNLTPLCFTTYMDSDPEEAEAILEPRLAALREEFGLPPLDVPALEWSYSPDKVLAVFPEWFHPPKPDWITSCVQTDFLVSHPMFDPLDEDVVAFLEKHKDPIVYIYGTFNLRGGEFIKAAYDISKELNRPTIILGWKGDIRDDNPEDILLKKLTNLEKLLPHASLFVHHSGVGTMAEGIRAGVPHVALPNMRQQRHLAQTMADLNLGITIDLNSLDQATAPAIFKEVLESETIRESVAKHALLFKDTTPWQSAAKIVLDFAHETLNITPEQPFVIRPES